MKKLIALLAAIGAVVFFWRKKHQDEDTMWDAGSSADKSWGEAAPERAGDTAADGDAAAADADEGATS